MLRPIRHLGVKGYQMKIIYIIIALLLLIWGIYFISQLKTSMADVLGQLFT